MTNTMLGAPIHPRKQMKCFEDMSKDDAPSSCRKEPASFPLENKITEPANSRHAGTNATSPLSNVASTTCSLATVSGEKSPSLSVQRQELLPEPEPSKSHSTRSDKFVFSEPLQLQHLASFSRQLDGDAIHLSAHPFGTLGMAV
jgi:hypothetical protein